MRDYFAAKAMQGFAADPEASWWEGTAQHEVSQAKRIQQQTGCTWTEALRIAHANDLMTAMYRDRNRGGRVKPH